VIPAVVASAAIFSLCHVNIIGLPALFELGLVFGFLYARTRSVLPGMVAHLGSNLTATLLYVVGKGQDTGPVDTSVQLPAVLAASAFGWVVLGLLLAAARRMPQAWGEPMAREVAQPRFPLSRAVMPWALAASVSLAIWGLADRRGIELDLVDLRERVPPPRAEEPEWARSRRARLDAMRKEARRGDAPVDSYVRARRELARALQRNVAPPADAADP
jgi:membrane protease YdiL (CAAX protease family)